MELLKECLVDSPAFRKELANHEKELAAVEARLKSLFKATEKLNSRMIKVSASAGAFADEIHMMSQVEASDQEAVRAYTKFSQALKDVETHRQTLGEQLNKTLVDPLKGFIEGPLGEVKESKKMYEKLGNDLDSAYNKYAGVSPRKPDDAAMAENLVDATKSIYNYVSLDYVSQVNAAMAKRRFEVLEKFVDMMFAHMSYYTQCFETFRDIEPFMRSLMEEVQKRSEEFAELDREMEKRHDLVKVQREVDNAKAEAQAGRLRNEVQIVTMSPSGSTHSINEAPSTPTLPNASNINSLKKSGGSNPPSPLLKPGLSANRASSSPMTARSNLALSATSLDRHPTASDALSSPNLSQVTSCVRFSISDGSSTYAETSISGNSANSNGPIT